MPKSKSSKKLEGINKSEGFQKIETTIVPFPNDPSSTDINRMRETTRANLAKYVLFGLFGMLFLLALLLFLLIILDKPGASIFKDILLSFIGFASGVLVSIFGFYYKEIKDN